MGEIDVGGYNTWGYSNTPCRINVVRRKKKVKIRTMLHKTEVCDVDDTMQNKIPKI